MKKEEDKGNRESWRRSNQERKELPKEGKRLFFRRISGGRLRWEGGGGDATL